MIKLSEYQQRRESLMAAMVPGSIAIIASQTARFRSGESELRFRQDSDFYYLTGFNEPNAYLVLMPGRDDSVLLFNQKRDPAQELWVGKFVGQEAAPKQLGVDKSFPFEVFEATLPELLRGCETVYYRFAETNTQLEQKVSDAVLSLKGRVRAGDPVPHTFRDLSMLVHEMRMIKSPAEVEMLRTACAISANAHKEVMGLVKPGMKGRVIEAELMYRFMKAGSREESYTSIVASGEDACTLHYVDNDGELVDGDLILIDAGGEYFNYCSDITRTFPVNGRFSEAQRAVYEAVLKTQLAVIDILKPGVLRGELQTVSERVLTEELVKLGILTTDVESALAEQSFRRFYPHYIGHWMGLDTHDVGIYKTDDGQWRPLEAGMVFTVEPGVYIPTGSEGVDPKWWGIGVRIEDDILLTESGPEVLTAGAPKTVAEIEALMSCVS